MDDLCLHKSTFDIVGRKFNELINTGKKYRVIVREWKEKRSLSQNDLSHMWYGEISSQLIKSGRNYCTPEWVKRNLKKTYLGYVEVEYTDFVTGEIETRHELRHTADLDVGEMHYYLQQIEAWCGQMSIEITIPDSSEYRQLQKRQEA